MFPLFLPNLAKHCPRLQKSRGQAESQNRDFGVEVPRYTNYSGMNMSCLSKYLMNIGDGTLPYFTIYQQTLCYFYVLLTKLSMHLPFGCRIMKTIIVIHGKVTMGLITWIIIGAAVGWLANRIRKSDKTTINLECILAGMAGGTIGGLLTNVFYPPGGLNINFTWQTAISAAIGSFFVLMAYFVFEQKQQI
jgi:uncharacterized membrane protein YeaQ/YmgE (transglycosylase-associated protein family)